MVVFVKCDIIVFVVLVNIDDDDDFIVLFSHLKHIFFLYLNGLYIVIYIPCHISMQAAAAA